MVGVASERKGRGMAASIGRFQVMALLQAARYYILFGDVERAKSFGLNRAIFYSWAKRRGAGTVKARRSTTLHEHDVITRRLIKVGDEAAYVSDDGWFEIGGQIQRPDDYDREIASRIAAAIPYDEAWKRALEYVGGFDKRILESQREFYSQVYEPVRDKFLLEV